MKKSDFRSCGILCAYVHNDVDCLMFVAHYIINVVGKWHFLRFTSKWACSHLKFHGHFPQVPLLSHLFYLVSLPSLFLFAKTLWDLWLYPSCWFSHDETKIHTALSKVTTEELNPCENRSAKKERTKWTRNQWSEKCQLKFRTSIIELGIKQKRNLIIKVCHYKRRKLVCVSILTLCIIRVGLSPN